MSQSNSGGVTILELAGAGLAGYLSWIRWHSIFFAVVHALFGWLYVIYCLLKYGVPK